MLLTNWSTLLTLELSRNPEMIVDSWSGSGIFPSSVLIYPSRDLANLIFCVPLVVAICATFISWPGGAFRGCIVIMPSFDIDIFWNSGTSIGSKSTE